MEDQFNTMKHNPIVGTGNEARDILMFVYQALQVKGYDPVDQLVGYMITGDPTYITSYNSARSLIGRVERDTTHCWKSLSVPIWKRTEHPGGAARRHRRFLCGGKRIKRQAVLIGREPFCTVKTERTYEDEKKTVDCDTCFPYVPAGGPSGNGGGCVPVC